MATNREAKLLLKYEVDRAGIAAVQRSAQEIERSQEAVNASLGEMGFITKANVGLFRDAARTIRQDIRGEIADLNSLNTAFDMSAAIQRDTNFIEQLRAEVNGLASDIRELPDPSFNDLTSPIPGAGRRGGGSGRRGDTFGNVAGDFGTFFSAAGLGGLGQVGDILEAGERLGVVGGVAAAGVVLVNAALGDLAKKAEEAAERQRAYFAAIAEVEDLLAKDATSAEFRDVIAARELETATKRGELEAAEALIAEYERLKGTTFDAARQFEANNFIWEETDGTIQGVIDKAERLRVELAALGNGTEEFRDVLGSTDLAMNDAAAAAQELKEAHKAEAEARKEQIAEEARLRTDANIEAANAARERDATERELRSGTAEQARQAYAALEAESRGLSIAIDSLRLSGDQSDTAQAQLEQWNEELAANSDLMVELAADIVPYLDGLEAQHAALQLLIDAGQNAVDAERELAAARKSVREEQERHLAAVDQIEARQTEAELRAENERERALGAAVAQATERQQAAEQKAREDRETAEREHYQKLRDIQRQFRLDFQSAVGERDALTAYNAQVQYKEARRQENEAYEQRRRDIDKALRDTTAEIDRNLRQQQATIAQRYQEQLQTAANAANAALQLEQQRYEAEYAIRLNAYNGLLAQAQAFAETLISIGASLGRNIVVPDTETVAPEDLIEQGYLQPDAQIPSFDRGTSFVPHDMLAYVHRGERITPAAQNTNNTSNANIIIQMDGRSFRAASRREAARYVGELLGGQGIE